MEPVLVPALEGHNVVDVVTGPEHTIALTSQQLVFVWGGNSDGQVLCSADVVFDSALYTYH